MKRFLKNTLITSVATILLLPIAVSAHEGHDHGEDSMHSSVTTTQNTNKTAEQFRQKIEEQRQASKEKLEEARTELKQKLGDAKRGICNKHVKQINSVMSNMNNRRQKAFDHITKVYDSVKAFYEDKKLSSTDYESLVASVEAAKSAASASMNTQQSAPAIDCSGDHPKVDIVEFKAKRLGSIDAMQTYRQSVKELIQVVKETVKASEA
jgi:hypothetical protein